MSFLCNPMKRSNCSFLLTSTNYSSHEGWCLLHLLSLLPHNRFSNPFSAVAYHWNNVSGMEFISSFRLLVRVSQTMHLRLRVGTFDCYSLCVCALSSSFCYCMIHIFWESVLIHKFFFYEMSDWKVERLYGLESNYRFWICCLLFIVAATCILSISNREHSSWLKTCDNFIWTKRLLNYIHIGSPTRENSICIRLPFWVSLPLSIL